jgi:hypothetical protein
VLGPSFPPRRASDLSFAAAPPAGPADLRLPPRYAGEPLSGHGGARFGAPGQAVNARTARPAAPPIYGFHALGGNVDAQPVGRRGAVREFARPASSGWVALVGEFGKQGCYEVPGDSVPLAEVLRRCEGLGPQATGTIRLVRGGMPAGTISPTGSELLRPGDLLVADGAGARRYGGVTTASYERERPADGVRLGVVGATERPLSIKLDQNKATVAAVIGGLGQTLSPRDVTVLVGGSVRRRGDEVAQLTDGSVVVFDPRTVDVRQVAASGIESQTYFYPVQEAPSELPSGGAPEAMPGAAAAMPAAAPAFAAPSSEAMPTGAVETPSAAGMSLVPPPPADENLSSLPSVEMLGPPADEPPLGYPRTADASGSIPVGPPDVAEPHITAVPAASFYGGPAEPRIASAEPAAPPVPTDSLGPATSSLGPADTAEPATEQEAAEEPSLGSLAATVLVGGVLGAITFLGLRRLRGRGLPKLSAARVTTMFARPARPTATGRPAMERPAATTAGSAAAPSDMLAALIADRLAFREEPVELPPVLRIFGRSSAMRKRRVDPAAAGVPEPHFPVAAPIAREAAEVRAEAATRKAQFRIDPAESPVPNAELAGGTPFERALAARHRAAAQR